MFNMKLGKPQNTTPQSNTDTMQSVVENLSPPQQDLPQDLSASLPSDIPDHFDDLINEAASDLGIAAAPAATSNMLSPDDFHKLFVGGFKAGHKLTGLQSLKLDDGDEGARDCAYAIHETIVDVPMLHFILQPGNKWLDRAFAIGLFTVPMAISVRAELAARRSPPTPPSANFSAAKKATAPRAPGEPDAAQVSALVGA